MQFKTSFKFRVGRSQSPTPITEDDERIAGAVRDEFWPAEQRYRQRLSRSVLSGFAGFVLVAISLALPEALMQWLAVPGVTLIALSLLLFFTLPQLRCPSCSKMSDSAPETFCPACGTAGLQVSKLLGTRCNACGRTLGSYKYRNYPIRYCTHCGVPLSARGV